MSKEVPFNAGNLIVCASTLVAQSDFCCCCFVFYHSQLLQRMLRQEENFRSFYCCCSRFPKQNHLSLIALGLVCLTCLKVYSCAVPTVVSESV